jgi:hypothetical protein
LSHPSASHLIFNVAEGGVVLTEVIGHVAVGIDAEKFGSGVYEELDKV